MSRSERYIPPSKEQLERRRQSIEAAKRCDQQRMELLRASLKKIKKVDLVEITLRLAQESKASEWMLEQEVGLDKPAALLVHDIEVAIDIATKVDESRLNYNFDYDHRAYEAIRRGLLQLIQKNAIDEAKNVALKLMDKGSYQVECSDEGLMHEEIESCLRPVIAAAKSSGGREWALEMLRQRPNGFSLQARAFRTGWRLRIAVSWASGCRSTNCPLTRQRGREAGEGGVKTGID